MKRNVKKKEFLFINRDALRKCLSLLCILCCSSLIAFGQKVVKGRVIDATGETVVGANVVEKGTTNGSSTDLEGEFTLTVGNNAVIRVSFIGYVPQEVAVGNQTFLNIVLQDDSQTFDDVVVTALGIKRDQKALAYSTQTVKSEAITAVKGAEVATSLTGKISGLKVINTAEFEDDNKPNLLQLRGETALLVIDGMPVYHANMREIAADDIESITVLKGPTASALYGSRGSSGAIMITTKRATKDGLDISFNSSNMFHAGFLVFPQPQTHYSAGNNGIYDDYDDVWGDLLDIGRMGSQYNPYTYEYEMRELKSVGKNNLKNFTVPGYTLNNNVSLAYKAQNGSFRSSLTQIHQKGYYPNQYANRFSMNLGGDIHLGRLDLDASMNYTRRIVPNFDDDGNGQSSPLYTMTLWMGTDWDIRD
ncbi:MAG: carboxypeptidase-like regulatory domain-containing protein, partial [Tannerella sp.]|nr:carboxypeptidase-like regulatory domain-containing protein [Tannerella sp.]